MGLRGFFPVYGGWCCRGLLRVAFIFVHFGVGLIWRDCGSVVSSLLVILPAILPFVTNFSRRVASLKVCSRFYLMSFYLWLL